jgi:Mg/Co/Ni transporter MgtE
MEHEDAKKIESLLDQQDDTIANLTTRSFIRFVPDMPAELVMAAYRKVAEDADVRDYIYVVDHDGRLQGVVSLPELLMAKPETHLKEIMTADVVCLDPNNSIADAREIFSRYGFHALPVTDENEVILGAIPWRDIMQLEHTYS